MIKPDIRGFSLMELLVVVVIIGILAAAAAPDMARWFSKRDMVNATQSLYADLQAARMEAVKLNNSVAIIFDKTTTPHRYRLHYSSGAYGNWKSLPDSDVSFLTVPSSTTGFNSRGMALRADSIVIKSTEAPDGDNIRTITLSLGGSTKITP
ncbi:prepilin-type N-terminal cleavage/methylation domain-containing protein [archaeon]|nr:prepilin-type N-terminal cleavage/methylation domain-containing protein [archaeon]